MKESQWLKGDSPYAMLQYLKKRDVARKIRLYACAWFRRIAKHLSDERGMRSVEVAERFADGLATDKELKTASVQASRLRHLLLESRNGALALKTKDRERLHLAYQVANAAWEAARPACRPSFLNTWHTRVVSQEGLQGGIGHVSILTASGSRMTTMPDWERAQGSLLLEVFGNPFRPVALDPRLRTETTTGLAFAAYDERHLPSGHLDPARLAVLADALEEAGCADEGILSHLRSSGPHVRGCWALDLILGKE